MSWYCENRITHEFTSCTVVDGRCIKGPEPGLAARTDSNGKVWSDADMSGLRFVAYGGRHVPSLEDVLALTAEYYRKRYRMAVREEAT